MSEISLCYTYRPVNIYLGSIIIVEVGTAMPISSLLEWGQILDPAILVVLTHSVKGGEVVSSCEDDRATQVDGTGPTIKVYVTDTPYISPHDYMVSYFNSKL